jgi:hypothetical protein
MSDLTGYGYTSAGELYALILARLSGQSIASSFVASAYKEATDAG